jgi:hypothetical protein
MATERTTKAQRIRAQNVAEREIHRFRDDHALWHKHVHNVELDPMQVLKCKEMDEHSYTVDFSCRRTGKTTIKELWLMMFLALHGDQELGIVGPREAQSITNLNYHLEAIRRSPILSAYLNYKGGRQQLADTYYQFANRSVARAYGIFSQVDGGDLTCASLEEVDDMPRDRLFSRFLLMMGATRRLGASKEAKNDPRIHITGVYKGADTLSEIVEGGNYKVLPAVDCHLGVELGILNAEFIAKMQRELSPDEYIRQLLCTNVSAKNLIWERFVRRAMHIGLEAGLQIVEPMPGETYRKRGLIGLGYDAGGHGEKPESSKHALVISEQIGEWVNFPYVITWPAGADDNRVMRDIVSIWRYFRPDYAIGDAYGVGMISTCNDVLLSERLIDIDRRVIGDGDSTASTWPEWAFSPMRFEGMTKHVMAQALRQLFHNGRAVIPYFDDQDDSLIDMATVGHRTLVRQLPNIRAVASKAAYPKYEMVRSTLGDDTFDAAMAAVWALASRGLTDDVEPVILTSSRSRTALLEGAA